MCRPGSGCSSSNSAKIFFAGVRSSEIDATWFQCGSTGAAMVWKSRTNSTAERKVHVSQSQSATTWRVVLRATRVGTPGAAELAERGGARSELWRQRFSHHDV